MTPDDALWLDAGLDGELDAERSLQLARRLASDPAFKAAWESSRALRQAIRDDVTYHRAPAALRARLTRAMAGAADAGDADCGAIAGVPAVAAPARRWWTRRGWLAVAGSSALAGAALSALVVVGLRPPAEASRDVEDAVAGHARALLVERPIEVASSDQHTVRPWLSARLGYATTVPDLSAHGFELVGARRDIVDGHPAAALVYKRRQHVISAYLRPAADERAPVASTLRGFNVVDGAHRGTACVVVSDLNAKELGDFVELLRAAL